MIEKQTLHFLASLAKNNNKPWFDANKNTYLAAKENMLEATRLAIDGLNIFDEAIAETGLQPKSCISRINRDIRFSKNKMPYKNNFFSMFKSGGKKSERAGYFMQIEPGRCFIGAGAYMPMPPELQKMRQEIDYNFNDWNKIIESKKFLNMFPAGVQAPESLVRPPKGVDIENPALPYLKMKGFYVMAELTDAEVMDKKFTKNVLSCFETGKPFVDFLNAGL